MRLIIHTAHLLRAERRERRERRESRHEGMRGTAERREVVERERGVRREGRHRGLALCSWLLAEHRWPLSQTLLRLSCLLLLVCKQHWPSLLVHYRYEHLCIATACAPCACLHRTSNMEPGHAPVPSNSFIHPHFILTSILTSSSLHPHSILASSSSRPHLLDSSHPLPSLCIFH